MANWYNGRDAKSLAYQMVKYRNRAGWTHKDALRIAHPQPVDGAHDALYGWATGHKPDADLLPAIVMAFEAAQVTDSKAELLRLIVDAGLTREMVPDR